MNNMVVWNQVGQPLSYSQGGYDTKNLLITLGRDNGLVMLLLLAHNTNRLQPFLNTSVPITTKKQMNGSV